ncbi:hypothetical protein BHE74_00003713 [Ensete ventricosum]|nr:hypothetical protein BHE74_00003713 [Ensete ventricosum]
MGQDVDMLSSTISSDLVQLEELTWPRMLSIKNLSPGGWPRGRLLYSSLGVYRTYLSGSRPERRQSGHESRGEEGDGDEVVLSVSVSVSVSSISTTLCHVSTCMVCTMVKAITPSVFSLHTYDR